MHCKTKILLTIALCSSLGLRARSQSKSDASQAEPDRQTAEPRQPPPAEQTSPDPPRIEDDPAFKLLSPAEQEWVMKQIGGLHKAIADTKEQLDQQQPAAPQPLRTFHSNHATAPAAGCTAPPAPPKKPGWLERHLHIKPPAAVQSRIDKERAGVEKKTGISMDASPAAACPPSAATGISGQDSAAKQ
jgi:hypothetical protein